MTSTLGALADTAERYTGQALAFGLGLALANVLDPAAVALRQSSWQKDGAQIRALDAGTVARLVAEGIKDRGWGEGEAAQTGVDGDRLELLVEAIQTAPPLGTLLELLRRGTATDGEVEHAFDKHMIEPQWRDALRALQQVALEPGEIAKAIHRGIMVGEGLLVVSPPTAPGKVPAVPASTLDPVEQASWSGLTKEQLRVLVGNAGLPPGIVEMLQMLNRGLITEDDFLRGVGESNLRNEWGPPMIAMRRRLLTPHDYVEGRVRAWIDDDAMHAGAALSGVTPDDTDLLFKIAGRPLSWHQVFIGERRGGRYGVTPEAIDPAFLKALEESNVRPEWYGIAWAQRYSYPSSFVLRSMAQAGELTLDELEQILLYEGWEPTLAHRVAVRWTSSSSSGGKHETVAQLSTEYEAGTMTEQHFRGYLGELGYAKDVQDHLVALGDARRARKYREATITAVGKAYQTFAIDDVAATSELAAVHVTGATAGDLLRLWNLERLSTITNLSATQIQKAYKAGFMPLDQATIALEHLRYTPDEVTDLLGP